MKRCSALNPVEIAPGVRQLKTKMVTQDILIERVHEDGENQCANDRKHNSASYVAFHLTGDVRGELEADKLEEYHTDQARQTNQTGIEGEVRTANCKSRFACCTRNLRG